MKIKSKRSILFALLLNFAIIVMEIIGLVKCANEIGFKNLFVYYTEDSNIFLLITSIIVFIYLILKLTNNKEMPKLISIIRFASVCTVLQTFLIVVFVLGFTTPTDALGHSGHYQMLFVGSMLFHHFLCPVLSLVSFLLFERKEEKLTIKDSLFAFVPTIIYGTIIMFLNIIRVVVGPYPFLLVYEQSIFMSFVWAIAVLGCAFAITIVVGYLHNTLNKKIK